MDPYRVITYGRFLRVSGRLRCTLSENIRDSDSTLGGDMVHKLGTLPLRQQPGYPVASTAWRLDIQGARLVGFMSGNALSTPFFRSVYSAPLQDGRYRLAMCRRSAAPAWPWFYTRILIAGLQASRIQPWLTKPTFLNGPAAAWSRPWMIYLRFARMLADEGELRTGAHTQTRDSEMMRSTSCLKASRARTGRRATVWSECRRWSPTRGRRLSTRGCVLVVGHSRAVRWWVTRPTRLFVLVMMQTRTIATLRGLARSSDSLSAGPNSGAAGQGLSSARFGCGVVFQAPVRRSWACRIHAAPGQQKHHQVGLRAMRSPGIAQGMIIVAGKNRPAHCQSLAAAVQRSVHRERFADEWWPRRLAVLLAHDVVPGRKQYIHRAAGAVADRRG